MQEYSLRNHLVHLVLLFTLINSYNFLGELSSFPSFEVLLIFETKEYEIQYKDGWEEIGKGWPKEDDYNRRIFNESTTFFYTKGTDRRKTWNFNATDLINDQVYRLSFKYWSWIGHQEQQGSELQTKIKSGNYLTDNVHNRYFNIKSEFSGNWMPVEYVLSGQQLKDLSMIIETGEPDSLVAFKDIKLEWQSADKNGADNSQVTQEIPDSIHQIEKMDTNIDQFIAEQNCFEIEYMNSKDIKLNVILRPNISDSNEGQNIFTFRPKETDNEKMNFCLDNLVALSADNLIISFNVEHQSNINDKDYLLIVNNKTVKRDPPKKVEFQNFLLPMNKVERMDHKKWQDQWTEISVTKDTHFNKKDDHVQFYANGIRSYIPVSAYLISDVWIKNDPSLHLVDSQYSIEVDDNTVMNGFTIRPKVCDGLSHCEDVIETKRTDSLKANSFERTIDFKFNPIVNSDYIKLQFYVEYFKPAYIDENEPHTLEFKLKLTHFGDPCFQDHLCPIDKSTSCHSDPILSEPNKMICSCASGWTGQFCEQKDFCRTMVKLGSLTQSGGKFCELKGPGTKESCESMTNGFRCLCGGPGSSDKNKIIWVEEGDKSRCLSMSQLYTQTGWKISATEKTPLNVEKSDNSLVYHFTNINTKKFDVTLNLVYNSDKTVRLSADYILLSDRSISHLFDINLKVSAITRETISFRIRDFIHSPSENFDIEFKVFTDDNTFTETTFVLNHFIGELSPIAAKTEVDFIESWLDPINVNHDTAHDKVNQVWHSIPNNNLRSTTVGNEKYYQLEIPKTEQSIDYLFLSDWIRYDPSFDGKTFDFTIRFTKTTKTLFRVYLSIIYQGSDQKSITVLDNIWNDLQTKEVNDTDKSKYDGQFTFPTGKIQNVFKIVFRIEKQHSAIQNQVDLEIRKFSLGDPCYMQDHSKTACPKDISICLRTEPNTVHCECKDSSLLSDGCVEKSHCFSREENTNLTFVEYCAEFPNARCDPLSPKCICDEKNYKWDDTSNRCVQQTYYYSHRKTCEGNTCNLFDKIKADTKWWDKAMPRITENNSYLPFRFSTQSGSKIIINVTDFNQDDNNDLCLNIDYDLSGHNSGLQISYEDNSPIELTTHVETPTVWPNEIICFSNLVKDIGKDFNIVLKSRILGSDSISLRINQSSFINTPKDFKITNTFDYLRHAIKDSAQYKLENQWPLAFPQKEWAKSGDHISFEPSHLGKQNSYLISNWIKRWDNITGYKLRFKIFGSDFTDYTISFEMTDERMRFTSIDHSPISGKDLIDKDKKPIKESYVISLTPASSFFRIVLKVTYNYPYLSPKTIFRMKLIDVGDPCVDDSIEDKTCNDRGTCIPINPVNKYRCECRDGYMPSNDCYKKDYCVANLEQEQGRRNGSKLCSDQTAGECHLGGIGNPPFYCDCFNDTSKYWVYGNVKRCIDKPKCPNENYDPIKQICNEKDNKTEIHCNKGFVEIKPKVCEKYDVCNKEHREKRGHKPIELCVKDKKSHCYPTFKKSDPEDPDDFICACEAGYESDGGKDPVCLPKLCELPSKNKCEQKCTNNVTAPEGYTCDCINKDLYELSGNSCKPKSSAKCNCQDHSFCVNGEDDCQCKGVDGQNVPATKEGDKFTCKTNAEIVSHNVCPDGKTIVENNELVCDCGLNYNKTDKHFCSLKSICGEGSDGRKDCDRRNKFCFPDYTTKGYLCAGLDGKDPKGCPPGMFDDNGVCVDNCKYRRREDCSRFNAFCNSAKEYDENERPADFCYCRPGFVQKGFGSSFMCVVGKYTVQFSLSIKNTIIESQNYNYLIENSKESHFGFDLNGYYREVKIAHEINLDRIKKFSKKLTLQSGSEQTILKYVKELISKTDDYYNLVISNSKVNLFIQNCEENDQYLNCKFTLTLDKKPSDYKETLNKQLERLCIPFENSDHCFFPFPQKTTTFYNMMSNAPTHPTIAMVIIASELEKSSPTTYKTCEESRKQKYSNCEVNSNCEDSKDPENSLFKCTCDSEFYDTLSTDYIDVESQDSNNDTIREHCIIREDLCDEKCYHGGSCTNFNISIFRENSIKYYVPILCDCPQQTRKVEKTRQCVDVCHGMNCGNGKCVANGEHESRCDCDNKYTGQFCDTKLSEGGWIAAVAVLAVVVVIVAGVAIFFSRRKRNLGINSPSTRQLDDFSDNTSYRVRQSGGVV